MALPRLVVVIGVSVKAELRLPLSGSMGPGTINTLIRSMQIIQIQLYSTVLLLDLYDCKVFFYLLYGW